MRKKSDRNSYAAAFLQPVTLRFSPMRERVYQRHTIRRRLPQVRLSLIIGTLFFLGFGAVDLLLALPRLSDVLLLRFVGFAPAAAILFLLTLRSEFNDYLYLGIVLLVVLANGLMVTMMVLTPWPTNVVYYVGTLVAILFCFAVAPLPFSVATGGGIVIVATFGFSVFFWPPMPAGHVIARFFIVVSFLLAGMLATYRIDRAERISFLQSHQVAIQQTGLRKERNLLERRVALRTEELSKLNSVLEARLAERNTLLQELSHRVYNNLQLNLSLIRLQRIQVQGNSEEAELGLVEDRLRAMEVVHRHLYEEESLGTVGLRSLLEEIVENKGALLHTDNDKRWNLRIPVGRATPLALLLNESFRIMDPKNTQNPVTVSISRGPAIIDIELHCPVDWNMVELDREIVDSLVLQIGGSWAMSGSDNDSMLLKIPMEDE